MFVNGFARYFKEKGGDACASPPFSLVLLAFAIETYRVASWAGA